MVDTSLVCLPEPLILRPLRRPPGVMIWTKRQTHDKGCESDKLTATNRFNI